MKNCSVVIPTYNGRKLLNKHLPAIIQTLNPNDEVIIIDDASSDETSQWWQHTGKQLGKDKQVKVRLLINEKNQRFAATVNRGVWAAHHPLVWILNNDVEPISANPVNKAIELFTSYPKLFAIGCRESRHKDGRPPFSGRGTGGWEQGLMLHWYDKNQSTHDTLWTSGGSMFVRRDRFKEIGGFDRLFAPAYEEDRDLSYRALKTGWDLWYEPSITVFHDHETTNSTVFSQWQLRVMSWRNQFLIVWKNISDVELLLSHLLWLPYHLLINGLRTRGASLAGFFGALLRLPQLWQSRQLASRWWQRGDKELLSRYNRDA